MDDPVDLASLARVWERVASPSGPGDVPEDRMRAQLALFIRNSVAAGGMYALLASKTRGSAAERTFRRLAREEADTERRLQTRFFLLTGDTCAMAPVHPSAPSVTGAVREAYLAELENAERYRSSARLPGDSGLFEELAGRERSHAEALRLLLERTILY